MINGVFTVLPYNLENVTTVARHKVVNVYLGEGTKSAFWPFGDAGVFTDVVNDVANVYNRVTLLKNILPFNRYMCLPTPQCKIQAKYIWIDGSGESLRSKTRTLDSIPECYKDLPKWGYDGSSTFQSDVENSDCILVPVAMYNDPIRGDYHKLVLCETFDFQEKPTKTNHRYKCVEALNQVADQEVMVGFEQEYVLLGMDGNPFGWPPERGPEACRSTSTYQNSIFI
ncbi:hypothetical protein NQ317_004969 [Molorchus minor]|uniref:GS beta-grasp domain-containing protein n=1 Tax=Molorchus minor TaxID=1323400 RepID=A0ABQ9K254_9CUCU|nr:hypothetical protein NQ317_004969 [Molorchus minor]